MAAAGANRPQINANPIFFKLFLILPPLVEQSRYQQLAVSQPIISKTTATATFLAFVE